LPLLATNPGDTTGPQRLNVNYYIPDANYMYIPARIVEGVDGKE